MQTPADVYFTNSFFFKFRIYKVWILEESNPRQSKLIKHKMVDVKQEIGREKDENRAELCLSSVVFSFASSHLWCSILVIKVVVRFYVLRGLPNGEVESRINGEFFKTNYWMKT